MKDPKKHTEKSFQHFFGLEAKMIQRTTFQFQLWFKQVSIDSTLIHDDISNFVISFLIFNNTFGLPPHPVTGTTRIVTCLVGNRSLNLHFGTGIPGWGVDPKYIQQGFQSTKNATFQPSTLQQMSTSSDMWEMSMVVREGPNGQKTQGSLWFERPTRLTFSWWFCKKMTCVGKIWLVEQDFYSFWPPTSTCKEKMQMDFARDLFLKFQEINHGILAVIWHVLEKPLHFISSHKSAQMNS